MKVSEVIQDEGRICADLIQLLESGRWELSGKEAEKLVLVRRWVASLAQQMAKELSSPKQEQGMKIKSMGQMSGKEGKKSGKS